jgi:hypothetical protein
VLAVLLGATVWLSAGGATNPRTVTVATYNIYQGTELEHVLAAQTPLQLAIGVATDYANVIATNFPERAAALAAQIDRSGAALVGLQEVATWRTQVPSDGAATPATHVTYDFLQILLDALEARGLHYSTVNVRTNFEAEAPGLFATGLMDVRLSEQTAIIARTDLPTDELKLSNPQSHDFVAHTVFPFFGAPFSVGGGWLSVDAKVRGKSFRFITTHMDPINVPTTIRPAQAEQLLAAGGGDNPPLLIVGDTNSEPGSVAYNDFITGGLTDTWLALHPNDLGYSCCQVPPDSIVNATSQLHNRVDLILAGQGLDPLSESLLGADPSSRTPSGLWASDHAGLSATFELEP